MTASDSFVSLVKELMAPLGSVTVRRMFGGAGVYVDGQFIAIIAEDTLYFKTDDASRTRFEESGSAPFRYGTKNGPGVLVSYWRAPDALFDDAGEMCRWAADALRAAHSAAAKKSRTSHGPGPAAPRRKKKAGK